MKTLLKKSNDNHIKVRWVLWQMAMVTFLSSKFLSWLGINDHNYIWFLAIITYLFVCFLVIKDCDDNQISLGKIVGNFPEKSIWMKLIGVNATLYLLLVGVMTLTVGLLLMISPTLLGKLYDISSTSTPVYQADFILQFVCVVIMAPLAEEFVFRGIILNRWIEKWGVTKALIASSCLFGLLHPLNMIGISMLGLVFGILYLRYQNLWVVFFCHALHNAVVFLITNMPRWWPEDTSSEDMDYSLTSFPQIIFISVGLFTSAISLLLLWRVFKLKFPRGYVQPSYKVSDIGHSKFNYSMYVSRSIIGFLTVLVSALVVVRSDMYRSTFAAEPYRSLAPNMKDVIDRNIYELELLVDSDKSNIVRKIDAVGIFTSMLTTYEVGAKSIKDPDTAKLAVKKSQEIKKIRDEISEGKMGLNPKILKEFIRKSSK
jgi:uncharacterized protein